MEDQLIVIHPLRILKPIFCLETIVQNYDDLLEP